MATTHPSGQARRDAADLAVNLPPQMLTHGEHDAFGSVVTLGHQVPCSPSYLFFIAIHHAHCLPLQFFETACRRERPRRCPQSGQREMVS